MDGDLVYQLDTGPDLKPRYKLGHRRLKACDDPLTPFVYPTQTPTVGALVLRLNLFLTVTITITVTLIVTVIITKS